jgi:hypothetical protein
MLKKGTIVTIYEDPLTRMKAEGEAKILCHEGSFADGLEYYRVVFTKDRYHTPVVRKLIELVATEQCCCREQPGDDPDCKVHCRQVA